MSKNVLVISASFRDVSNSDTLAKAFMKGAVAAGHKAEKSFCPSMKFISVWVADIVLIQECAYKMMMSQKF